MPQIIPALIGAGGSLAGGLLGGPSSTSTSSSHPNWLPGQQDLMSQLFAQYVKALGMGPGVTQSDRNALMTQINNSYAGIKPNIEESLTQRGFGQSGKLGQGFQQVDEARVGAQQQGESGLQSQALQRWLALIGMGPSMGQPFGGTTSTSTGTQQPGLGGVVSGAINPLGAALTLNNPFMPQASPTPSYSTSSSPSPAPSGSDAGGQSFSLPPPPPPGFSQPNLPSGASGYLG
jgi:hypothetical protein